MIKINNNTKYHFFTIWPNGFDRIDSIIELIRAEEALKIITIKKLRVDNMKKFVLKLYGCDTVPLSHLKAKLAYLYPLPPQIVNVFVKNFHPDEHITGMPPFRKTQDQTIVRIKNKIRNLYNPKHPDPEFHIKPLNKGVSHEHVIHASDYEGQVDYYLKTLGHNEGIFYLDSNDDGLPFEKPYHIPRPKKYSIRKLDLDTLYATVLVRKYKKVIKETRKIKATPHYQGLSSNIDFYRKYLNKFRFAYLCDDYSVDKFSSSREMKIDQIKQLPPILVYPNVNQYIILDGVHRAAAHLYHNIREIDCVVFEE